MAAAADMYALALSLESSSEVPKIIPASELYELRSKHVAVPLQPKSVNDFKKGVEYGRFTVIGGQRKLVRYIIFKLDDDVESLKKDYKSEQAGSKRFRPPKRLSTAPTVEDARLYTIKGATVNPVTAAKLVKTKSAKSTNDDIYRQFLKKNGKATPDSNSSKASSSIKASSASRGDDQASSSRAPTGNGITNISSNGSGSGEPGPSGKEPFPYDVSDTLASNCKDSGTQTDLVPCMDSNHVALQLQLSEALTKYEVALLEIKASRRKLKEQEPLAEALKRLEQKIDALCLDKQDQAREGKGSDISDLSNLVDDEEVDSDKVKIDDDLYLNKAEIIEIEKKTTKFRPRVEAIVDLVCEGSPDLFGISGFTSTGEALIKFNSNMQEAVGKILGAMAWDVIPKKFNQGAINHRISNYLCEARTKRAAEKKDPTYKPDEFDEEEEDEIPRKRRRRQNDSVSEEVSDEDLNATKTSIDLH